MAVQGGNNYQGISEMLINRMNDIRDTYTEERKKRLEKENAKVNAAIESSKPKSNTAYRLSFKSGQVQYTTRERKDNEN